LSEENVTEKETTKKWLHKIANKQPEKDPRGLSQHEPGAKMDSGKIRAGVLADFPRALAALAKIGDYGCRKYSRSGWLMVPNGYERYKDAFYRHLIASESELNDPESGLPHKWHMLWNAAAMIELEQRGANK